MSGTLYLVGTPIGNLGDLGQRAREVLASVDVVACEDTRRTRKLLTRFGITASVTAVPHHDEARRAEALAARLGRGESVAFVSDAGMPGVSDPGRRLVLAALAAGAEVTVVPGPSAVTAAVAVSGLDADRFAFLGFLPRKKGERDRVLDELNGWGGAIVVHEAPSRLCRSLAALAERFGAGTPAVVVRELTKLHEEIARGTLGEFAERFAGEVKGEVTLVIGPRAAEDGPSFDEALAEVRGAVAGGARLKDACRDVAARTGHPARELYRAATGNS